MVKNNLQDQMIALIKKLEFFFIGDYLDLEPRQKFVTWLIPSIPFKTHHFEFCKIGLKGYQHKVKNPDGTETEIDASTHSQILADHALVLSSLFDFIPNLPENTNSFNAFCRSDFMIQNGSEHSQDTVSSVYKDVLSLSRVYSYEHNESEKEKLADMRKKLNTPVDQFGNGTISYVATPMMESYIENLKKFMDSLNEYMNFKMDMLLIKGDDPGSLMKVLNELYLLKLKKNAAYFNWVMNGHKNEVQSIEAYLEQSSRNMLVYKNDLLMRLEKAKFTTATMNTSTDAYYTVIDGPESFFATTAWAPFRYSETEYDMYHGDEIYLDLLQPGISLDLLSRDGTNPNSENESIVHNTNQKCTGLTITFESKTSFIGRSWFDPAFFSMKTWILDKAWEDRYGKEKKVSDGKPRPMGKLIAYPDMAIFVRNVVLSFEEVEMVYQYIKENSKLDHAVRWGPLLLSGSYYGTDQRDKFQSFLEDDKLKVPGIQLICLINNFVPKSPDPDSSIKAEQFV